MSCGCGKKSVQVATPEQITAAAQQRADASRAAALAQSQSAAIANANS